MARREGRQRLEALPRGAGRKERGQAEAGGPAPRSQQGGERAGRGWRPCPEEPAGRREGRQRLEALRRGASKEERGQAEAGGPVRRSQQEAT